MAAAIDAFGAARLLTHDRDPTTRAATVEVTHESLLRAWQRLRSWTDAARDDLRTERRVAAATREWIASDGDPSFLLTGARLEQVEAWRERSALATTSDERDFLDASVAERDRRVAEEDARREREAALTRSSYRRLRAVLTVSLIAALVAASLTVYGFRQRDRARLEAARAEDVARAASARELSASALANLEVDPERSVLLALEAIHRTRHVDGTVLPEAEEALHAAVGASRIVRSIPDVGGALSWSPDGRVFVTEGPEDSGVIDIRDATTGASVREWHGHDIDVNDVAFSPDGSMLATAGDDGAARVWDPSTGEELFEVTGEGQVWHTSWSPDGSRFVATWPDEGVVRVVDAATGDTVHAIAEQEFRLATAFSADGGLLAISEPEDAIHLYDVETGEAVGTLPDSTWSSEIAPSPDGRWIAAGHFAGDVIVWDARTRETRFTLYGGTDVITSLVWSPGSDRLLTGSGDGRARLYEVSDTGARETMSLSTADLPGIQGVAFSPDGDEVMLSDRRITAVQVHDVSPQGDGEWATFPAEEDFTVGVSAGDGDLVVATGEERGTAAVWDVRTGERSHEIGPHADAVLAVAVAPETGFVTTAGGPTVITSDGETWQPVFTLELEGLVDDVAWNADGSLLAAAVRDGPIRLIDRAGRVVRSIEWGDDASAWRVQFSPDGRYLGAVRMPPARFDPAMPMLRIWDLESDEVVATMATQAETFAFHPDGDTVATGQLDGDIETWDVLSGRRIDTLVGHNGIAISLAYGPDGSQLVSGGSDATVRLWDVAAGVQRVALQGHDSLVYSVDVSADGSRVVSGDAAGSIRVWAVDLEDLVAIAEDGLTRSLTGDECRQYLHLERCP
jgi:WD40 repeat protein